MIRLYDTCSILNLQDAIFSSKFLISNISLTELEQIKTSGVKDEELKFAAKKILRLLKKNEGKYGILIYNAEVDDPVIKQFGLVNNNDSKIIASVYNYYHQNDPEVVFYTSDLACSVVAMSLNIPTKWAEDEFDEDDYTGYKEITMDDLTLANFYSKVLQHNENLYDLKENEYLIIRDKTNKIVDKYRWASNGYIKIQYISLDSTYFGTINPQDDYQQLALNSLVNNQITVLRGKPGSGKSYLAFGYLMNLLERGKIDKIIIFANTVAVRGAAKLGFYPGSKDDKLLDSQIGNFLVSKLGDIMIVKKMIEDGTLVLIPTADCRGYDTTGMNAGILVTEAQNFSRDMMKLVLQRLGEDSVAVIEGDDEAQLDMKEYVGDNNGLRAVSKAFRGEDIYGEVRLNKIHRSKIAEIADKI